MLTKLRKLLWPSILGVGVIFTALFFTSARAKTSFSPSRESLIRSIATSPSKHGRPNSEAKDTVEYVRRGRIRPKLHTALDALGDRLEKLGKERLTLTGTLTRNNQLPTLALLIWEYPGRLRLEDQLDGSRNTTIFDGNSALKNGSALTGQEEGLIEMLVHDSGEHFLIMQTSGAAIRFLGSRFRLDDSVASDYKGPFYDLYETSELIPTRRDISRQTKVYYINSDTHLLERVRYRLSDGNTQVEVLLKGWHDVQGQRLPGEIVRLENNTPVWRLTIASAVLGPRAADTILNHP